MFLSVLTRPDIAEVVARLCRYMHAPTSGNLKDAKYVLRYLKGSSEMGLTFRPVPGSLTMQGFSDSNFTTPDSSGKSVSGYLFNMGTFACYSLNWAILHLGPLSLAKTTMPV